MVIILAIVVVIIIIITTGIIPQFTNGGKDNIAYLSNKLVNFTPLFDIDYTKKKNMLVASLFKMQSGGYKNFDKYINGLSALVQHRDKYLPDFAIRLFIDKSILTDKKIMDILRVADIELVLYDIPTFYSSVDASFHSGTIGTLIRIFPLFDFDNNDANVVIISDTDVIANMPSRALVKYNYTLGLGKDLYDISKSHISANVTILSKYSIIDGEFRPYTIIDNLVGFSRIPANIIIEFLSGLKENIKDYVMPYSNSNDEGRCEDSICFGIDEYFSNTYLLNKMDEDNLQYSFIYNYSIHMMLYFIQLSSWVLSKEQLDTIQAYQQEILTGYDIDKTKTLESNIYNILNSSDNAELIKSYRALLTRLYLNNDYSIYSKKYLNMVMLDEFKDGNNMEILKVFNKDNTDEILRVDLLK